MLADRGVDVSRTIFFRWTRTYRPEIEKRTRPHLRSNNGSWRVDETYVRVKGRWMYRYRAVDSRSQTIDFLLSAKRDTEAAKQFFRKALGQRHTVNPRTITVDKNPAYPCALEQMKDGTLWRFSRLRQCKFSINCGTKSPACETPGQAGAWLRQFPYGLTKTGGLGGDGNDQERSSLGHRGARHPGPSRRHHRVVPGGRLICFLL
jgi:hypothetical protein